MMISVPTAVGIRYRRLLALLLGALLSTPAAAQSPTVSADRPGATQVWVFTYLKAQPGRVEQLAAFIRLNWFAMDSAARRDGNIVDYQLLRPAVTDTSWDLLEVTIFADSAQHARADSLYRTVYRRAHRTVPVDGRGLAELGTIVRSVVTRRTAGQTRED